jgi:hypothetical protein
MVPTRNVPAERLRKELETIGIKANNLSRSELVNTLEQSGIFEVDLDSQPRPPRINLTDRASNVSNVYIGNGAGAKETRNNQLHIANSNTKSLIHGDFQKETVNIDKVLNLKSEYIDPDLEGEEGDIRRDGSDYFVYRTNRRFFSETISGWYPIAFGPVKIV